MAKGTARTKVMENGERKVVGGERKTGLACTGQETTGVDLENRHGHAMPIITAFACWMY